MLRRSPNRSCAFESLAPGSYEIVVCACFRVDLTIVGNSLVAVTAFPKSLGWFGVWAMVWAVFVVANFSLRNCTSAPQLHLVSSWQRCGGRAVGACHPLGPAAAAIAVASLSSERSRVSVSPPSPVSFFFLSCCAPGRSAFRPSPSFELVRPVIKFK